MFEPCSPLVPHQEAIKWGIEKRNPIMPIRQLSSESSRSLTPSYAEPGAKGRCFTSLRKGRLKRTAVQ